MSLNKIFTIASIFIFLSINTTYGQILMLPTLVHHYLEHAEWDQSSFYDFLCEHYAKKINHPDDQHADHQKLPFKAANLHIAPAVALLPTPQAEPLALVYEAVQVHASSYHPEDCANAYLNSIWQPPCMG